MVRYILGCAVILAGLTAAPSGAGAQIVDIQPLLDDKNEEGFKGALTTSLTWKTGNVDLFLGKADLFMRYNVGLHRLIWTNHGVLGFKGGFDADDRFQQDVFSHLRWQWLATRLLTWETYAQAAHNDFRRVSVRAVAGTGPRFEIVSGPAVSFAVALSYMYEHVQLDDAPTLNDGGSIENNHRVSLYITGKFQVDTMLYVLHTTYFQPRLDRPHEDFVLSTTTTLGIALSKLLSLKIALLLIYDSKPPISVYALDTALDVGLTIEF